jgi:adenylate kinase
VTHTKHPLHTGYLVAVFGISGVGKTTLIDKFVRNHKTWQALSASNLLARLTNRNPHELRVSDRSLVETNQLFLAEAIHRQRTAAPETNWLLDAHSTIDNDRELVTVPCKAIALIDPDSLIFVFDDAAQIRARRAADRQRQRPLPPIDRIEEEQALALQTCLLYSVELKLDLYRISANDAQGFSSAIAKTMTRKRSEE